MVTTREQTLLIDMDGVLYVGEQAIPGARQALEWLQASGIPHLFLTNTTSRPRSALVEKLGRMGMHVRDEQIFTPPVAASAWLHSHQPGPVALYVPTETSSEFAGLDVIELNASEPVSAVVIGDYGERWTYAALNQAFRRLMQEPRPALIALGMTRYWRAEDGLRLDAGPIVKALEYASSLQAVVLGKPASAFFETALQILGADTETAYMIGDDIRGDIGGAQALGIKGLLVKTGKFRSEDLADEIQPTAVLDSIADLPGWWESRAVDRNKQRASRQ